MRLNEFLSNYKILHSVYFRVEVILSIFLTHLGMESRVPLSRTVALNFHRKNNKLHYASKDLLIESECVTMVAMREA